MLRARYYLEAFSLAIAATTLAHGLTRILALHAMRHTIDHDDVDAYIKTAVRS